MASPPPSWFAGTSKINEADQSDPQQPIHFDPTQPILLEPTPLRSEPYIPPTMDLSENIDFEEQMEQVMIVLPTHSTIEEKNKILETNESAIILTGAAAALAQGGPTVGSVDIGENEDSYLFRVSIPGALKEDKFRCDVDPDGKVFVQGVTTTGGKIVCRDFHVFKMKTQNLCPPGHFSVSIQLPGPVESEQKIVSLDNDGILEGIVKKKLP
ncbi:hypothetical protein ACFX13_034158 [Malus domestica]|nr:alpha-crystallin domain-containing protein 22.3-like [Malus domestica]XP_017187214.1 alpha-crystallin domain-containing protein 22.3-like [Malus domestica]XP_028957288.1 alpha-crystallin domain-containing protein 22.3-like [Malus domestica]XP_028957289.1 alpha-crystallin domain-containing protein 22.3-like [Malus domestica]